MENAGHLRLFFSVGDRHYSRTELNLGITRSNMNGKCNFFSIWHQGKIKFPQKLWSLWRVVFHTEKKQQCYHTQARICTWDHQVIVRRSIQYTTPIGIATCYSYLHDYCFFFHEQLCNFKCKFPVMVVLCSSRKSIKISPWQSQKSDTKVFQWIFLITKFLD